MDAVGILRKQIADRTQKAGGEVNDKAEAIDTSAKHDIEQEPKRPPSAVELLRMRMAKKQTVSQSLPDMKQYTSMTSVIEELKQEEMETPAQSAADMPSPRKLNEEKKEDNQPSKKLDAIIAPRRSFTDFLAKKKEDEDVVVINNYQEETNNKSSRSPRPYSAEHSEKEEEAEEAEEVHDDEESEEEVTESELNIKLNSLTDSGISEMRWPNNSRASTIDPEIRKDLFNASETISALREATREVLDMDSSKENRKLEAELNVTRQRLFQLRLENDQLMDQSFELQQKLARNETSGDPREVIELRNELTERDEERKQYKEVLHQLTDRMEQRNQEKKEIKMRLTVAEQRADEEARKRMKSEEQLRDVERRLELEEKKTLELNRDVERRINAEETIKRELEKTRKKLFDAPEESSSLDAYSKSLQVELDKLRVRLGRVSTEREQLETLRFQMESEINDLKEEINRESTERQKKEKRVDELEDDLMELRQKLLQEQKDRRLSDQIKNLSLEYKIKFQKEWEQKLKLETTVNSLEREVIILRKKLEGEGKQLARVQEDIHLKDLEVHNLNEKMKKMEEANLQKSATSLPEDRKTILTLQYNLRDLQTKLQSEQERRHQAEVSLKGEDEGSLEVRLHRYKKENHALEEQIQELNLRLRNEAKKRDEILVAKVRVERALEVAKRKLSSRVESTPVQILSRPSTIYRKNTPSSPNQSPSSLRGARQVLSQIMTEQPNILQFVQDLITKVEEQATIIATLEQDISSLPLEGTFSEDTEHNTSAEYVRKMERELERANSVIQFQNDEYTHKTRELETTRNKMLSMLTSDGSHAHSRSDLSSSSSPRSRMIV
ncbi:hypothetical protein PROFUN_11923 [Planoprotostelium fungivorum]|uniref:Uncharacterized protein n=1 Tax=Planoprotostelium fungivorum TaxID=1890364 RepID=A0A2P6N8S9_9EUKA|nr:hypothetical protein PROFUN_11923 [Planoprotostelium fungivorum]